MNDRSSILVSANKLFLSYEPRNWFSGAPKNWAVQDVSLDIRRGEVFGVVGESGSGKSSLGRMMMRLEKPTSGEITFEGKPMPAAHSAEMRSLRRRIQMVFQDPYASLDPRRRVGAQIADGLRLYRSELDAKGRQREVEQLLERVGLPTDFYTRMPHELSGGQRQRVAIARALAPKPDFIVADEPVSALDVSIQAQIVNLFSQLQREFGLTIMFISHDLHVVRKLCDRVAVMQNGRIVEQAETEELFHRPKADYTRTLMDAAPLMPVMS